MSNISVTPITDFRRITELAETGNLYVVNNSDQQNQQTRGNVALDIVGDDGRSFAVVIPDTWIPINLASYAETGLFLKANTFRSMVRTRNLLVISTDEADTILASRDAIEERNRVDEYRRGHSASLMQLNTTAGAEEKFTINTNSVRTPEIARASDDLSDLRAMPHGNKPPVVENPDDNALHRLIADFNAGAIEDHQVVEALRALMPTSDAIKIASGSVRNTGSKTFEVLGDMIAGSVGNATVSGYRGPTPPAGF